MTTTVETAPTRKIVNQETVPQLNLGNVIL